jgi:hypothetical protein
LARTLLTAALVLSTATAMANLDFDAIRGLPPGERYTQLSLLLLISGGTEPELVELLSTLSGEGGNPAAAAPGLRLDDYQTPLARIVDQETMLAGAARLIRFAQMHDAEIKAEMEAIGQANPILISMIDVNEIAADAIIIRNAIADGIEYSDVADVPGTASQLRHFRAQTIYLRNMMEYNIFQEELARITDDAIVDLGGRLDAYQRMFDEDVDANMIRQRIESAEIMNAQAAGRFDENARMRTSEILMMLILMESQVRR